MYSLPFLPLKAPRWHFHSNFTLSPRIRVGENAVLELSKPELVRNACFYIELVSVTYVIGHKEWLQRHGTDVKACSHDPIFGSNYLSGIDSAHRNVDSRH